ncbi:MAG: iron ABC transporter permease, partial [Chloroflexota bacterium]|nr:iron ABC transporter permease [Chloroflexota bacterium]
GPGSAPLAGRSSASARRRARPLLVLAALTLALLTAMVFAAAFGAVSLPPDALLHMTLNQLLGTHFAVTWRPQDEAIFFAIRLPRVTGAALVGAALGAAGVLFQGLLRNALADPYALGVSGGAALGGALGFLLSLGFTVVGFTAVPVLAFLGALAAMGLVYSLARVGGRAPVVNLLLAGFAISAMLGYAVSFLLILNDRLQLNLPRVYGWLLGGVSVGQWSQLWLACSLFTVGLLGGWLLGHSLDALGLGEEAAQQLGVPVERDKRLIMVLGSLLTAVAVALGGLIGFVGLFAPHMTRLALGPGHRVLLVAAALFGATFLVLADLLARVLLPPTEVPVGILTAFVGGPLFLWLLRRQRRDYRL